IKLSMHQLSKRISNFVLVVLFVSCGVSRQARMDMRYLDQQLDTLPQLKDSYNELQIQKGDLLSIVFYSDDPETAALYNEPLRQLSGDKTGYEPSQNTLGGYLVDQNGNIYIRSV